MLQTGRAFSGAERREQVADFVLDLVGVVDRAGDLLAQQPPITLAQTMHGHPDSSLAQAEFLGGLVVRESAFRPEQALLESVEEGARRTRRTPRRADWRLVREIFVAESDAEARRLSVGGMMGRMMREYFLPLLTDVGVIQFLKHDTDVADGDVTPEYCARHNWLIGSPATVVEKIERMYEEVGGFGAILLFCFDYSEDPDAWYRSMRLLAEEVMPKVAHLIPEN